MTVPKSKEPATKDTVVRMRIAASDKRILEDAARKDHRTLSNWLLKVTLAAAKTSK